MIMVAMDVVLEVHCGEAIPLCQLGALSLVFDVLWLHILVLITLVN